MHNPVTQITEKPFHDTFWLTRSEVPSLRRLLGRLVDVEGNRSLTLEFTGDDAGIIINIIGGVSSCIPPQFYRTSRPRFCRTPGPEKRYSSR